jgi:rSAM/selenodomain-associated transferase 2
VWWRAGLAAFCDALKLSIIVPVLNEAAHIVSCLTSLQPLRQRGAEVITVDGGSSDNTPSLAGKYCDRVISSGRGRSTQQNGGARAASGDTLLFLHVDTRLPEHADALIEQALSPGQNAWGRFDVTLDAGSSDGHPMLNVIAAMMNFRSRTTGIATGDQCIFVRKSVFFRAGTFPQIPLMEDVALSRALKKISAPACLREHVRTSARRWQERGVWRTIMLMWWLRFAYWIGVPPARLAAWYR